MTAAAALLEPAQPMAMPRPAVVWLDPGSGRPLRRVSDYVLAGDHAAADAVARWPVVDGIPFLRPDRDALRRAALADLDRGDVDAARARLLADQDPFAPLAPPAHAECLALADDVRAGRATLREAMRRLGFGPVADYFAHRTCTPTFLSGLGLLAQHGRPRGPVVDVACGIGQFVRELAARQVPAIGLDLVFAKVWLARRFLAPEAVLVCGDATRPPLALASGAPATVFCHDAFYFLPDKARAARAFLDLAGSDGRVLVGHAHNAAVDHGVAGTPLVPERYGALFPGATLFDDAAFAGAALQGRPARPQDASALGAVEAVSLAWPVRPSSPFWHGLLVPPDGAGLVLNPLLQEDADGRLAPLWPSARFAAEYVDAGYLHDPPVLARDARRALDGSPANGRVRAELVRRRVLLAIPERW